MLFNSCILFKLNNIFNLKNLCKLINLFIVDILDGFWLNLKKQLLCGQK